MENNKIIKKKLRLVGKVIQDKLDKTITVEVVRKFQHPIYKKIISSSKKYLVHDSKNEGKIGEKVIIEAGRKYSARKRFRLITNK